MEVKTKISSIHDFRLLFCGIFVHRHFPYPESVRSYYNLIVKKAGQFLSDLQVSLLKFALSLRAYSPAVHASQQVTHTHTHNKNGDLKPTEPI